MPSSAPELASDYDRFQKLLIVAEVVQTTRKIIILLEVSMLELAIRRMIMRLSKNGGETVTWI